MGARKIHHLKEVKPRQATSGNRITLPDQPGEIVTFQDGTRPNGHGRYLSKTADGNIWIANQGGVIEIDGQVLRSYTSDQGFIDGIEQIIEDDSGNLWMSGTNGLMRWDRSGLTSYRANDGLEDQYILAINRTRDGKLYTLGADLSLSVFDGQNFHTIAAPLPPASQTLWSANPAFQDSRESGGS